jgi:hypothetical protein
MCALALSLACGCDDGVDPIPLDGSRRDGGVRMDSGRPGDGGSSDGGSRDGGSVDAGPRDASGGEDVVIPDFDAGPDIDSGEMPIDAGPRPDAFVDFCTAIPAGTPCGAGDSCAAGTICLDNGCGERRCLPSGHACRSGDDCAVGSTCTDGICIRPSGCADSRDCPAGFACEVGECVDRRNRCAFDGDCPFGFLCDASSEHSAPFCIRAYTRCDGDFSCPFFGECLDVLGDGNDLCFWAGGAFSCRNNADCPVVGEVCGVHPVDVDARCRPYGPCVDDGDCGENDCIDLWGDGVPECATVGECENTADCPAPGICGVPIEGGSTVCVRRPF